MEINMLLEKNATKISNEMLSDTDSTYVPYNERIETYIVPVVFAVIFIVGVLGNGTLVIIFFRHRAMRNIPNTYILSLALADLLVIIICVPTSVVPYVVESWPWGDTLCRITECAKDISIGVSVFTLTALSGERYCAIVNPLRKLQTRPLTVLTASMIWLLAILFAIPPAVVSQTQPVVLDEMNMTIRVCSPYGKYPTFSSYAKYTVVAKALVYYLLPLSIIGALYILMANRLHISARNMPGEALGMQSRAQARARRHVARMVVAFVVVFFVCFFPSHLFALWFQLYPKSLEEYNEFWHTTRIVGFCTSFLNSCANPVALYCVSGVFRQHFNRYLCCFCYKPSQRNRQHSTTCAPDTSIMSTRRSTTCNRSSLHMTNNSIIYHTYPNDFEHQQSFQMQHSVINSNGGSSPNQSIILSDKR